MKKKGAKLGQHFLAAIWPAVKLTAALGVHANETILEIGPGKGMLTRELLKMGAPVVAVEKDAQLIPLLREKFKDEIERGVLRVVEADIRSFEPEKLGLEKYAVAANIPYYITGGIIRLLLTARVQPKRIALLVQKEVAQRVVAEKGSILSISVKAYGTPRLIAKVGKGAFHPPPNVDSAILLIEDISRNFFQEVREDHFFRVVRMGFSSKRKLLSSNLAIYGKEGVAKAFGGAHVSGKARAENLSLAQWKTIAQALQSN